MAALKVWIDGKLYDKADAKISVYDHGLLYGDGIFEGIRVYNGRIFECQSHIDRLVGSGILTEMTGQKRNRVYLATGILQTLDAGNAAGPARQ